MADATQLTEFVNWCQKHVTGEARIVLERREVRRVCSEALQNIKGGLRALYRTLDLPGANPLKDALDDAVLTAYGFSTNKDLLAQLLSLNLEVATHIEADKGVTGPGVPKDYPKPKELVTADCVQLT